MSTRDEMNGNKRDEDGATCNRRERIGTSENEEILEEANVGPLKMVIRRRDQNGQDQKRRNYTASKHATSRANSNQEQDQVVVTCVILASRKVK